MYNMYNTLKTPWLLTVFYSHVFTVYTISFWYILWSLCHLQGHTQSTCAPHPPKGVGCTGVPDEGG